MSALQFNGMLEALDRARERKRIRGASTLPDSTSTPYVAEGESRRSRKRPRHKKTAATSLRPSADHSPPSWDVDDDDVAWVKRLTFNGRARELCRRFGALTGRTRIGVTPRLPAATTTASQWSQEDSDWPPPPPLQPPAVPRPRQRRPLSSLPIPGRLYRPAPPSVAAHREWAPTPTAASRSSPAAAAAHHRSAAPLHPAERGVRAAPILLPGSIVDGVVFFQPRRAPAPTSFFACDAAAPPQPQAQLLLLAAPAKEPPPPSPRIRELPTHAPLTAPASGMPVGGTYADAAITAAHGAASDGGQAGDTTGHPPQPPVLPHGTGRRQAGKRRADASSAPPVPCDLAGATHAAERPRSAYASCRHAAVCAGPWACALDRLPPLPPTGAKRARAGLADQPIDSDELRTVKAQRAARALIAILPHASAPFILHDPPALVASRSAEDNAERMVRCLSSFGLASLKGAYSAYGRLASWMVTTRPATAIIISGSDVTDAGDVASTPTLAPRPAHPQLGTCVSFLPYVFLSLFLIGPCLIYTLVLFSTTGDEVNSAARPTRPYDRSTSPTPGYTHLTSHRPTLLYTARISEHWSYHRRVSQYTRYSK